MARFLSLFSLGGLYGMVVAFALNKTISNWHRKLSLTVIVGWALSHSIAWVVQEYFAGSFIVVIILFTGLSIVAAIKWARPNTHPIGLILIFASWTLAWKGGSILGVYLLNVFNTEYVWAIADPLAILLGLLFTLGIQIEGSRNVLKTAFFGALGFAVGNYFLDIIGSVLPPFPAEIAFALWGLIGGAILEAPSRDARRILFTSGICGIGLLVGSYVAFDILPLITVEYANSTLSDKYFTLRQPFLGMGLGLAFGILIRRASAIGVLAVLGAGIYMITLALNVEVLNISPSWENVVRGGLIGLVLGYGYGYMRRAKPLEGKPRAAKAKLVWMAIIGFLAIAIPVVIRLVSPPPFTSYRWDFDNSAQGWGAPGRYYDITVPDLRDGYLTFTSTGNDPQILSHAGLRISASTTPIITIRMRVTRGQGPDGQIFFITNQDNNWDETKSVLFALDQDGAFGTYSVLMSESPAWQGVITEIRLDPAGWPTGENVRFAIDYISVHAP